MNIRKLYLEKISNYKEWEDVNIEHTDTISKLLGYIQKYLINNIIVNS